jgi:hypothetical protein
MEQQVGITIFVIFVLSAIWRMVTAIAKDFGGVTPHYAATVTVDHNSRMTSTDNLYDSLRLPDVGVYHVHVLRQSGGCQRSFSMVTPYGVVAEVSNILRRAQIDRVRVTHWPNGKIYVERTMHNGRGNQEGRKIGGVVIQPQHSS